MRDSCIFYRSFYESIKDLPIEEQAVIYNAIFSYSLDFKLPELTGIAKSIFTLIKPQIDANIKRYNNGTIPKQKQEKSKTEAKPKQSKSKVEANVNDNVNDNDNLNNNLNENKNVKKRVRANSHVHPSFGFIKECFDVYYYELKNTDYYFQAVDGKKINSIIDKLAFKIKEKNTRENITLTDEQLPEQINQGFEYLIGNINDQWIKDNLSLSIIDSQFNTIVSKIINNGKDGKPKRLVDEAGQRLRDNKYS